MGTIIRKWRGEVIRVSSRNIKMLKQLDNLNRRIKREAVTLWRKNLLAQQVENHTEWLTVVSLQKVIETCRYVLYVDYVGYVGYIGYIGYVELLSWLSYDMAISLCLYYMSWLSYILLSGAITSMIIILILIN